MTLRARGLGWKDGLALVAAAAVVTLGAAILAAGRMYAATARVQSSV